MADQGKEDEDPRVDHLKKVTLHALNIDSGPWEELIWKEDNQAIIKDFLDSPSTLMLLVYFDHNQKLKLSLEIPLRPPMPGKIGYFLKHNLAISMTNYKREIMCGSVSNEPLRLYQHLYKKIFLTMFCNPLNNARWPTEITQDIVLHFQDFDKTLTYHIGLAEGRTVLVIPERAKMIDNFNIEEISRESTDWDLHSVLSAVAEMINGWIPIVRDVLEVTSEKILAQVDQGPTTEILFWENRKNNLAFIHLQLNDPTVKNMVLALEKSENCHYPLFKKLLQDVAEGLDEAFEISTSLTTMADLLQELEKSELPQLMDAIPNALKTITSSWMSSKYFNAMPSRTSVLVQKTSNLLIDKIHTFLQPNTLFKEEREKMKKLVKASVDIVTLFIKTYHECRDEIKGPVEDSKSYPWVFPDKRSFENFEKFIQRLDEIYEIFEAADIYFSIPDHKIQGVEQTAYKIRLENIHQTFCDSYNVFVNSSYNPLDLKSNAFAEDHTVFSLQLRAMDRKLGIIVGQACSTCSPIEEAFKLMNLLQDLITRPIANFEFKKLISSLVRNIYSELLIAQENYEYLLSILERNDGILPYKNLPPLSGSLQWAEDLEKKLASPIASVREIQSFIENLEDDDIIFQTYKKIQEALAKFQETVYEKWKETLKDILGLLNKPLFLDEDDERFTLSFDLQIMNVLEEIRFLPLLKQDYQLPNEAIPLNEMTGNLLHTRSLLASVVRWFNDLSRTLISHEISLILDPWMEIIDLLKEGLSKKWSDSGIYDYAENMYCKLKVIFENVNNAKENIKEVESFIASWNKDPMFVRDDPNSLIDFTVYATRVAEVIAAAKETAEKMKLVLQKNLVLFNCDENSDQWKVYILYLESIIEDGLKLAIECSLQYLIENTDSKNTNMIPFYKVSLHLTDDMAFVPSLSEDQPHSLQSIIASVIEKIYLPASEIRRMSEPTMNYLETIKECENLNILKCSLVNNFLSAAEKAITLSGSFKTYSDLWLQKIDVSLEDFILYGPIQETTEIVEGELKVIEQAPSEEKPPTEEEFRYQISQFDLLLRKVDDIPAVFDVESWFILDVTSFKDSLLTIVRNWSIAFKKKLIELKSQGKLRKLDDDGDT